MDTTILCVTHKEFDDSIVPDCYRVIKVGNMISDKRADELGYLRDNIDDNISNENPYYCELTAQYWGWKNLSSDIKYIGLCHYRRYFFDYRGGRTSIKNDILSADRIHDILQKHKIIMAFPAVKYPDAGYLYKNLPDSRQDKYWVIMESIIKSDYPEMHSFFMKVMYGKLTIWGNMLITTRDIFDEYSEWLFKVLKKYDKIIEEKGEMRIPRVDGFLSEVLLYVYFNFKYEKKDIYHLEVRNIETDGMYEYNHSNFLSQLIRFARKRRCLLVIIRYIRIGFLFCVRKKHKSENIS